jgi:hypothetical protein
MVISDYSKEVAVDTREGIIGYHYFELHPNDDTTAWKSYNVGKSKRFVKSDLDAKHRHGTSQSFTGLSLLQM